MNEFMVGWCRVACVCVCIERVYAKCVYVICMIVMRVVPEYIFVLCLMFGS